MTAAATAAGVLLGTAAYMSPEQARGKPLDKRTDIWSFGCVLFEMLTGQAAFGGSDVSEVLTSVLAREPEWTLLPRNLSRVVGLYIRRCLRRDPKQRIGDMQDVRLAMEGAFETSAATPSAAAITRPPRWRQAALLVTAVVSGALVAGVVVRTPTGPPTAVPTRFTVVPPVGVTALGNVQLSPDGRTIAFQGGSGSTSQVYVRELDQLQAVPLPGTEGAGPVAFSPDGLSLLIRLPPTDVLRGRC